MDSTRLMVRVTHKKTHKKQNILLDGSGTVRQQNTNRVKKYSNKK
jgi:hypothetical protein